jgi:hypothetical protein
MNNSQTITLTGAVTGNETAIVRLRPQTFQEDGILIETSVKFPEYEFKVETFFFGYNFDLFLKDAEEVCSGRANRSHLFNYNQTLVFEFINQAGVMFLSLDYHSVLPQSAEDKLFKDLRKASRLDSTAIQDSIFSFTFMRLHNPISEVTGWLTAVLDDNPISRTNPYPH